MCTNRRVSMRKKRLYCSPRFDPNNDWIDGKPQGWNRPESQDQKRVGKLILWIGLPLMLFIMAIGNYFG